jgi:geranylgeranyl pyrophosphate synthase
LPRLQTLTSPALPATRFAVAAGKIFRDDSLRLVLPAACGVELAHGASLVLDDPPSMDDAAIRRGKPCTHHAFPAWAADMTPVFLVTLAYRISLDIPSELKPIGFASLSPRRAGNRAELCRRLKRET